MTLTGLSGNQQYVIHTVSYYDTANVLLTGTASSGGGSTATSFTGEPMIDVTGKARDVLKRLRVRILINGGTNGGPDDNAVLPNSAIETQNLCKRIGAAPPTASYPQGSSYDTTTGASCGLSN